MTCQLVFGAGVSLRAVPRVMGAMVQWLRREVGVVLEGMVHDWTTGRWWLLRLGYAALTEETVVATDWVYIIDHTVQIGQVKCFLILGLRLSEVRWEGRGLRHCNVRVLALVPMTQSNAQRVAKEMEETARRTGNPRAIVSDHGSDVKGGAEAFCQSHAETATIYDVAHKGACLLKHRFERDSRWSEFLTQMRQAKAQAQQTELAYLVGPSLRLKARYMNVGPMLRWARLTLRVVERTPVEAKEHPRLEAKFGWLRNYREALSEWVAQYETVQTAVRFVRQEGLYLGAEQDLAAKQKQQGETNPSACELAKELTEFVAEQSGQTRPGERLPGSSEVLESCLGRWKNLERQQAKQGFAASVLALPAMLVCWTQERILEALNRVPVRAVRDWCRTNLGTTIPAQRRLAYAAVGCKQNQHELK